MQIFLKSLLILLFLFGIIWGYTHEVPYFSNTFDIRYLFFRFMFLGAIIGGILGWFLSKKMADKSDRLPLFMVCLFISCALFPLLGISTNHLFSKNAPLSMKAIFQKEEALRTSRFGIVKNNIIPVDAYYIYFSKDYKNDRIRSKNQSFNHIEAGTEIELPIKHGFWGFDFVDIQ